MRFWRTYLFLSILQVTLCLGQINQNGDFQIWQKNILKKSLLSEWSFIITDELRFGDDASKLYHLYLQGQISYLPGKGIAIVPGYRQTLRRYPTNSSHWICEYIPQADLTLSKTLNGWEFKDRNRVQYILSQADPYPLLYRNQFQIVFPWQFTKLRFTPFIDNEIFIRQGRGFNQDRLSAGFILLFRGNFSGQLFYMARFEKNSRNWIYQNILNLTLLLSY